MNSRYILALDPSGNYNEGQGTTGWCLFDMKTNQISKFGVIQASKFKSQNDYWNAHVELIDSLVGYEPNIVLEDYLLYSNRATNQINSRLETPQLIGVIKYECYLRGLQVHVQTATQVKTRWTDEILVNKKYITKRGKCYYKGLSILSDHVRDSIRHALHFKTYVSKYKEEDGNGQEKRS